jgi:hypothetical protein
MIKKYNQFVKGKINESNELDYPEVETPIEAPRLGVTKPAPITTPGTTPAPARPNPFPTTKPGTEPGPKAEFEEEEEEVGDIYEMALKKLADLAGVEFNSGDKVVVIGDKEVTFPAETEKYHVKGIRKPFATAEEVIASLDKPRHRKPINDMVNEQPFESKSYKFKRFKK